MMVSTRGRYAIRVMIDLAENAGKGYIPMWDIAKRQDISPNYLALRLTEENLAPVACLECSAEPCRRAAECKTLPMWKKVNCMLDDYFGKVSIQDIIDGNI